MFSFDEGVTRAGTNCEKWDECKAVFGTEDVLPMWVADMDFAAPQPVIDAMARRVAHGAFGYTAITDADYEAVTSWVKRRHNLEIEKSDVLFSPGVVDSLRIAVAAVTQPGDTAVILTPVYGPFYASAEAAQCHIRRCPLVQDESGWHIDFDDLEAAFKAGAKTFMLCNPHNPVGRVWTRAELENICALARKYSVTIISDEIHADLEMPGYRVTPILSVETNAIQLISAKKTFNLAALRHSSVLIKNADLRARFKAEYDKRGIDGINLFGALAQRTAYNEGEAWLNELLAYIDGNRRVVEEALDGTVVKYSRLEATYLMWLDMRALNLNQKDLMRFVVEKARLGLNDGTSFGEEGAGFVRLNLATPRKNVVEAMARLTAALKAL